MIRPSWILKDQLTDFDHPRTMLSIMDSFDQGVTGVTGYRKPQDGILDAHRHLVSAKQPGEALREFRQLYPAKAAVQTSSMIALDIGARKLGALLVAEACVMDCCVALHGATRGKDALCAILRGRTNALIILDNIDRYLLLEMRDETSRGHATIVHVLVTTRAAISSFVSMMAQRSGHFSRQHISDVLFCVAFLITYLHYGRKRLETRRKGD